MRRELRCGDEGVGMISDESPRRFCMVIGTDTFYFYDPIYDAAAVPGTVLTAIRQGKVYEFMRVSNGENPKWRITSIKDKNSFHTDYGERAANNLFGKILSLDRDETYCAINHTGLTLDTYKSNAEKKVLSFLSKLQHVETEEELRELVWDFKYSSTVAEWVSIPSNYIEQKTSSDTYEGKDILETPEIFDGGKIIYLTEGFFSFTTKENKKYLFTLIEKKMNGTIEQIVAQRGNWIYTFNHLDGLNIWEICSKIKKKKEEKEQNDSDLRPI